MIGVLGLSLTGASIAHKFTNTLLWDDSLAIRERFAKDIRLVHWSYWENVKYIIITPSIPDTHEAIKWAVSNNVPIYTDIDLFCIQNPNAYFICITGANGKSTTASLIYHILCKHRNVALGGNIGIPVFAMHQADIYVLELSSFQLAKSRYINFDISVLLNISFNHIDAHKSIYSYIAAKEKIFSSFKKDVLKIIGRDDKWLATIHEDAHSISGSSILGPNSTYINDGVLYSQDCTYKLPRDTILKGAHNYQNIAAAFAVTRQLGISPKDILDAITSFKGLEHRQEIVLQANGVVYINDSKATTFSAVKCALDVVKDRKIVLLLGGIVKESDDFSQIYEFNNIQHICIYGKNQSVLFKAFKDRFSVSLHDTMETAIDHANTIDRKDIVLFSPGCASYDQFDNFAHRGQVFKNYIRETIS